jgi:hypothetical protein
MSNESGGDKESPEDDNGDVRLSPIEEQYMKRELLRLEIDYEVEQLADWKNIGIFGYPFLKRTAKGQAIYTDGTSSFPVLYHVFIRYVKPFPFLVNADDQQFWQNRVQPFIESFADKEISTTADRLEASKRRRFGVKLKKLLLMYTSTGIRTTRTDVRPIKIESDRNESTVKPIDLRTALRHTVDDAHFVNGYAINVVGVRSRNVRKGFVYDTKWVC